MRRKASRLHLHSDFRRALQADERGTTRLVHLLGLTNSNELSAGLNGRSVRGTPLMKQRFQQLAGLINYTGELFKDARS
jgi:hypothetical protein